MLTTVFLTINDWITGADTLFQKTDARANGTLQGD
jgi:hypothetical protein